MTNLELCALLLPFSCCVLFPDGSFFCFSDDDRLCSLLLMGDDSKGCSCFPPSRRSECLDDMLSTLGRRKNLARRLISVFLLCGPTRCQVTERLSVNGEECKCPAFAKEKKKALISTNPSLRRSLVSSRSEFLGEAAFNQKLNTVRPDPRPRRLIKFLPLQAAAERETPFSCNLLSAQEVGGLGGGGGALQGSGRRGSGLGDGTKNLGSGLRDAACVDDTVAFKESGVSQETSCGKAAII